MRLRGCPAAVTWAEITGVSYRRDVKWRECCGCSRRRVRRGSWLRRRRHSPATRDVAMYVVPTIEKCDVSGLWRPRARFHLMNSVLTEPPPPRHPHYSAATSRFPVCDLSSPTEGRIRTIFDKSSPTDDESTCGQCTAPADRKPSPSMASDEPMTGTMKRRE